MRGATSPFEETRGSWVMGRGLLTIAQPTHHTKILLSYSWSSPIAPPITHDPPSLFERRSRPTMLTVIIPNFLAGHIGHRYGHPVNGGAPIAPTVHRNHHFQDGPSVTSGGASITRSTSGEPRIYSARNDLSYRSVEMKWCRCEKITALT